MSNILNQNQFRRIVESSLGPNCLLRISAGDTERQGVKANELVFSINRYLVACDLVAYDLSSIINCFVLYCIVLYCIVL